jgi:hypothetical protein
MKKNALVSATIFSTLLMATIGCKQNSTANNTNSDSLPITATAAAAGTNNVLTEAEKTAGYKLLFDGNSLAGWRTYQNKPADSWSVKDGTLYCKGDPTNKSDMRADMITTDQYENFDLSVDWIISPKGNSGIIYLASEEFPAAYLSGPEATPNPVGEWNTSRIVVNKGHVEHWLNGKKVVEYDFASDDWKKRKREGKWKDAAGYGLTKKGHIALQDHGSEAWFKNIKIKEL